MPEEGQTTQNACSCTTSNNRHENSPSVAKPASKMTTQEQIVAGGTSLSGVLLQPISTTTPPLQPMIHVGSISRLPPPSTMSHRMTTGLTSSSAGTTTTSPRMAPTLARTWSNAGTSRSHHHRHLHTTTQSNTNTDPASFSSQAVAAGLVSSTLGMLAIDALCQILRYGIDQQQHVRRNKFIKDERVHRTPPVPQASVSNTLRKTPKAAIASQSHPLENLSAVKKPANATLQTTTNTTNAYFCPPPPPTPKTAVVARGLINRGQTCYLNSILQALASCPPFLRYLHCISSVSAMQKHRQMMEFQTVDAGMSFIGLPEGDGLGVGSTGCQQDLLSDVLLQTLVSLGGTFFSTDTNTPGAPQEPSQTTSSSSSSWGNVRRRVSCSPPIDPTDVLRMIAIRSRQFRGSHQASEPRQMVSSVGATHVLLSHSATASNDMLNPLDQQQDAEELLQSLLESVTDEASRSDVLRIGSAGVELSSNDYHGDTGNLFHDEHDHALCVTASIGECQDDHEEEQEEEQECGDSESMGWAHVHHAAQSHEGADDDSSHSSLGSLSLSAILREMEREQEKRKCERRSRRRRRRERETVHDSHSPMSGLQKEEEKKVVLNGSHDNGFAFPAAENEMQVVVDGSDVDDGEEKKCGDINVWHHRRRHDENDKTPAIDSTTTNSYNIYENKGNMGGQKHALTPSMKGGAQLACPSSSVVAPPLGEPSSSSSPTVSKPHKALVHKTTAPDRSNQAHSASKEENKDAHGDNEPQKSCSASAEMMRMISELTTTSPTPLTGWLGSCLQCCACHHVRPIHNAPFVDIPVVPTAVTNYLVHGEKRRRGGRMSSPASILPSCTLEQCLESFTCVERVEDVECINCAIQERVKELEEEIALLSGAVSYCADNSSVGLKEELQSFVSRRDMLVALDPDDSCGIDAYLREEEESRARNKRGATLGHDLDSIGEDQQLLLEEQEEFFVNDAVVTSSLPPLLRPKRKSAFKCLLLTRLPSVLCLHIQRRYYDVTRDRMSKAMQHVAFPDILDVSNYCAYSGARMRRSASAAWAGHGRSSSVCAEDDRDGSVHTGNGKISNGGIPYRLMSVVEHKGTAHGGHYQTYRRVVSNPNSSSAGGKLSTGRWVRVSDSNVSFVEWREVRLCQAYMLFYEAM